MIVIVICSSLLAPSTMNDPWFRFRRRLSRRGVRIVLKAFGMSHELWDKLLSGQNYPRIDSYPFRLNR